MKRYKRLPPKSERRPKQFRVRVFNTFHRKGLSLTFHTYGKRPKRGQRVRIRGGMYAGYQGEVTRRHAPFYRGYTMLAEPIHPVEWSK